MYILMLRVTEKVSGLLKSPAEKKMIETASFFVSIFYSIWFLKSYLVTHAAINDLECFQQVLILEKEYPDRGKELLKSMQRNFWYLTQDLVVLALADDDDFIKEVLQQMLNKLLEPQNEAPRIYEVKKPILPTISSDTKLPDLLGSESWHLLEVAGVSRSDVQSWAETGVVDKSFVTLVRQLTAVGFKDLILKGKAIKKRIYDLSRSYTSLLNWKRCPKNKVLKVNFQQLKTNSFWKVASSLTFFFLFMKVA